MAHALDSNFEQKFMKVLTLKDHKLDPSNFPATSMRNICILAHVDHGKTCIADSLLTLNGLVNKRYVGTTKYLDDRIDEQDRKITMKSSAVSIGFTLKLDKESTPILINLVDTPGHLDFSTEIVAATRICDGALIVVDVVEGVSSQTRMAIKYAFDEKLKMILVINKLDRLIVDLHLPSNEMFLKILCVIEQCNLAVTTFLEMEVTKFRHVMHSNKSYNSYFDPVKGNVIFASATDGWGFTLQKIASLYICMIDGETIESLTHKLWNFDLFVSNRDKCVRAGAAEKNHPNIFSQLICSMLGHIYTSLVINEDESSVATIVEKLKVDSNVLPLKFHNCKMKLKLIMEEWSSLAKIISLQCYCHIPAPTQLEEEKINYIIDLDRYSFPFNTLILESVNSYRNCAITGMPIIYIAKLFINNKSLKPMLDTEMCSDFNDHNEITSNLAIEQMILKLKNASSKNERIYIMALVRIFSGKVYTGQELTALNYDYNPVETKLMQNALYAQYGHFHKLTVDKVYLLLGSEYKSVRSLGAGYICALTFCEHFAIEGATLSDTINVPPVIKQMRMEPIIYNVITPKIPSQSHLLRTALQLLQEFDTCLKTFVNEQGEYVLASAGTVHLEKCLTDLKSNFINIDVEVSSAIYSLRETVEQILMLPYSKIIDVGPCCKINIELAVVWLPENVAATIQAHHHILNMIQNYEISSISDICSRIEKNHACVSRPKSFSSDFYNMVVCKLDNMITVAMQENDTTVWNTIHLNKIMRIGNSKDSVNLIINDVTNFNCNLLITQDDHDLRTYIFNYLVNAFNLACELGPICKEPLSNCAFILSDLNVFGPIDKIVLKDPLIGNYITQQIRNVFLEVVLKEDFTVMEPVLEATIHADAYWLGAIFEEVHKIAGYIIPFETIDETLESHMIKAYIPAVDGEEFIAGIRKNTVGSAMVSLFFSHYKVISSKSNGNEEAADTSSKSKLNARAENLVKEIRNRKGITIHDQVIVHGEKQRTLKK